MLQIGQSIKQMKHIISSQKKIANATCFNAEILKRVSIYILYSL